MLGKGSFPFSLFFFLVKDLTAESVGKILYSSFSLLFLLLFFLFLLAFYSFSSLSLSCLLSLSSFSSLLLLFFLSSPLYSNSYGTDAAIPGT